MVVLVTFGLAVLFGAALLILLSGRREELRRYGVTDEIREAARAAEPDESAPEPEEFA